MHQNLVKVNIQLIKNNLEHEVSKLNEAVKVIEKDKKIRYIFETTKDNESYKHFEGLESLVLSLEEVITTLSVPDIESII